MLAGRDDRWSDRWAVIRREWARVASGAAPRGWGWNLRARIAPVFGDCDRRKVGRKRGLGPVRNLDSDNRFVFSVLEWRRGWDSNPTGPFRFCNLQIPQCRHCRECQRCRGVLPAIALDALRHDWRPHLEPKTQRSDGLGLSGTTSKIGSSAQPERFDSCLAHHYSFNQLRRSHVVRRMKSEGCANR